jgi:DNA-binding NarL/FixJ family response regulator
MSAELMPSMEGAAETLQALTVYGADIFLANEERTRLWTKHSQVDKDGFGALRAVMIENALRVAVFAAEDADVKLLEDHVRSGQIDVVVLSQVGLPLSTKDSIFHQLRAQRVTVVLIDLNSQKLDESIHAIMVTRAAAGQVAIFAIGDRHSSNTIMAAMAAGANEYLSRDRLDDVSVALGRQFWLTKSVDPQVPPYKSSPSDGSTPPTSDVFSPLRRGPRPMRPRTVALAI